MDPSWDMINNSGFRIISDHFGSPKNQIWDPVSGTPILSFRMFGMGRLVLGHNSPFCSTTTCQVPWQQVFEQFFGAEAWGVAGESVAGFDGAGAMKAYVDILHVLCGKPWENLWENPWEIRQKSTF